MYTKFLFCRSESGSNYHTSHRRNESMYAMTGLYAEISVNSSKKLENQDTSSDQTGSNRLSHDAVIRCHSRNPSSGLVDHRLANSLQLFFFF